MKMEELRNAIGEIPRGVRHCRSHHSFATDGILEHYFSWPKKSFRAFENKNAAISFTERTSDGYKNWVSLYLTKVEGKIAEFRAGDNVYKIRFSAIFEIDASISTTTSERRPEITTRSIRRLFDEPLM